jgi:hypothetical protein
LPKFLLAVDDLSRSQVMRADVIMPFWCHLIWQQTSHNPEFERLVVALTDEDWNMRAGWEPSSWHEPLRSDAAFEDFLVRLVCDREAAVMSQRCVSRSGKR